MTDEEFLSRIYSDDDFDYSEIQSKWPERECPLCNKKFIPHKNGRWAYRQAYCDRTHYMTCVVCNKPFKMKYLTVKQEGAKKTCSAECAKLYRINRTKEVMLDKYGVDNPLKVPKYREKAIEGIKKSAPETTKKIMATMNERYGGMGTASSILRPKIEQTMMERHGVTNPDDSPVLRRKISDALKSSEVIEKKKEASRLKWGTDYPSQSEIVQIAMQNTCIERYGVPFTGQIPGVVAKTQKTNLERYGTTCTLLTEKARRNAHESLVSRKKGKVSKLNLEFQEFFKSKGIETELELYVERSKSFDFLVKNSNIVIEVNPSYTHSDLPNHWDNGRDPDYHLGRLALAEKHGYRCIHIFDWDDKDKLVELLLPKERVYARKCELKKISKEEAHELIERCHIQGDARGAKECYGLFYNDRLISVMTFSKPRYNKNYEWELLRLCTDSKYEVVGGASRMFKHFLDDVKPKSVISYCDRAKFTGAVYRKMGMELKYTSPPAKVWSRGTKYITDNYLRQRGYDQIFGTDFGKGTDNEALMIRSGWRSVYDCGQFVFTWEANE